MANKRNDKKSDDATREIISLKDVGVEQGSFAYREEEDASREEAGIFTEEEQPEDENRLKKMKVPKAVYRVGIVLLVMILGLALWINRDSLTLENAAEWVKLQFVGSGEGDGFPVAITGSSVSGSNFISSSGNVYALSDTALTVLSPSGKELLSLRHSLNQPALRGAHGRVLLYNAGSTGYTVLSGTEVQTEGNSEMDIRAADVAQNGRFALGLRGSAGASELQVFQKDGTLQYRYVFAKDYITAVALNYDGTFGMVCTVGSEKGEIVSKVSVFDFNQADPVASFETGGNLLIDAGWTEGGDLYAVGDSALLTANSSDYAFSEYNYQGRQLTAYCLDQGRAFLSISAYEHAGPCTLMVFRGKEDPVRIESEERIGALSVSGGTVGALVKTTAVIYDYSTGGELGRVDAGSDAKSLALASESMAYILGVSEIRTVDIKS